MNTEFEDLHSSLADRYRVDRAIGSGGMATVYGALDLKHNREVAIKVLRPDIAASIGSERFLREIAIAARLQHPHILPLLDSGATGRFLYYVMPFARGESLRDRLAREGALPVAEVARILLDVADALRYAHEQGVIHRDIKPENIMLSGRHALVMDFGVARALRGGRTEVADAPRATTTGIALGTPAYMSPEQAAADPDVDHRTDLYSLGIVGWETVVGKPPFAAPTPQQVLAAHVTTPPPDLRTACPHVPVGFTDIIMRCLAKRPESRWATGDELYRAIEPFASLSSGSMTPIATQALPPVSRLRAFRIGAVVAVATVVSAAAILIGSRRSTIGVTESTHLTVDPGLELDPVLSPDGGMVAFTSGPIGRMQIFVRQIEEGNPVPVAADILSSQRWPRWTPDGRRIAFEAGGSIYLAPALGGQSRVLVEGTPARPAGSVTWSPDGSRIAYTLGGSLHIRDTAHTTPNTLVDDPQAHSLAWSPDGRWIAYVSGNRDFTFGEALLGNIAPSTIRIVPASGDKPPVDLTDPGIMTASPAWLPDSRNLLVVSTSGGGRDVYRLHLTRSRNEADALERLTTGLNVHSVSLDSQGARATVASFTLASNIWSTPIPDQGTASVHLAEPVTTGDQVIEDLDVSADGRRLAYDANHGADQNLFLLDLAGGRPKRLGNDPRDEFGPAWSPDAREIAYYAVIDGQRAIHLMDTDGNNVRRLTRGDTQDYQPKWSPDGRALVFYRRGADGDHPYITARDSAGNWAEPRPLTPVVGTAVSWSPDGGAIAFVDSDSRIRLLPAGGGEARVVLQPDDVGGGEIHRPEWLSPRELLVRQDLPEGEGGIWRLRLDGSTLQPVLWFDPERPSFRDDYATDGSNLYFIVSDLESDLWSLRLTRR